MEMTNITHGILPVKIATVIIYIYYILYITYYIDESNDKELNLV